MRISDWSSDVCSSDLAPVGDVAGLAFDAMHATAIEDATEAVDVAAQLQPGRNFGAAGVGLAAVGEHVEVERIAQPGTLDRVVGRADTGEHAWHVLRSEEHTSELQSLMRISYAGFCLKKKKSIQK